MHALWGKSDIALHDKSWVHLAYFVESKPCTWSGRICVATPSVLQKVSNLIININLVAHVIGCKVEFGFGIFPYMSHTILTIPNVIHTLDAFHVGFFGPSIREPVANEVEVPYLSNAIVILTRELVGVMDHKLPSFTNMPPNSRPRLTMMFLISEPIHANPLVATSLWVISSKFVMEHLLENLLVPLF